MKAKAESFMKLARDFGIFALCTTLWVSISPALTQAQSCETSEELDNATRTSITTAGQRYLEMAARGDVSSLRQNSIASLAADFSSVEGRVKEHQQDLAVAPTRVRSVFLLDASGSAPLQHAEFLCGVFAKNGQTANSAAFYLDNLPAGKYAVVLLEATSANGKTNIAEMLQQAGSEWKLGNLFISSSTIGGHDSDWFLARAREYKSKGQVHSAWLFYLLARNMISQMPFMYTQATDKLYEEWHSSQPTDWPADGKTTDLAAGGTAYKLTAVFPVAAGHDLDLIVKYQSSNVSNNTLAYQDNLSVIKAFVAKYPEVRDAFTAVVARAVSTSGQDYGTMLAMKDIK